MAACCSVWSIVVDGLLAGLERAQGGDHVDHRAGRVDARALERAGLDPAPGPGRAARAGDEPSPALSGFAERRRRRPSAGRRCRRRRPDRLAVRAHDGVAELVDERAVGAAVNGRCACSARPGAVCTAKKPSPWIAKSSGSSVSRSACGRQVGDLLGDGGALAERRRRSGRSACSAAAARRTSAGGAVGLVARGRGVGEVVGDLVLARQLGEHAGGRDVEATLHRH